jgi:ABC-type transport system involved in multi-copper enzyme maturation permease subunit
MHAQLMHAQSPLHLLAELPPAIADHLSLIAATSVVVIGLFVLGLKDVLRFAPRRVWAISGVCFDESVRRRILWIIPLAIVGLIIVVQLQQPSDEQDAIRQTTKFCLFATGLVVITSTIILACTSLPREIENRVIYTIVTKPTTRLEIVLGKIVGFSKVSLTILIIMGLFTFGYLHFLAWSLERDLRDRLSANAVEAVSRPTFEHYVNAGLLNAKTLVTPEQMSIFGQMPVAGSFKRYPTPEGFALFPFQVPANMWASVDPDGTQHPGPGMIIEAKVGYDQTVAPGKPPPPPPRLQFQICDPNTNAVLSQEVKTDLNTVPSPDGSLAVTATIAPSYVAQLAKYPYVFVQVLAASGNVRLWFNDDPANPPVRLLVPVTTQPDDLMLTPIPATASWPAPTRTVYVGRDGVSGQQVKGDATGRSEVCVFSYRGLHLSYPAGAQVPLEFRVGVEKSGEASDQDIPTDATIEVVNVQTGFDSGPIAVAPENNRDSYVNVPAQAVMGGNFNMIVRCLSEGQWINVRPASALIVQSVSFFALNLAKSLTIIWLLSILVIAISVFCSTFLSWPIAVVLTLVILFGRWGVDELGDAATAGIGRQFVADFGVRDPSISTAVSDTVEKLNTALKTVAAVLPDISAFSATDDIERGLSIPPRTLLDAIEVLLGFGVPLTVLAYVFLKNKEVAP